MTLDALARPPAEAPPTTASARVALVGPPNCGKTSLYNALTGSRQKVANYPGVTVERKEGVVAGPLGRFTLVDLPGTYSLRARSPDEAVTRDVVLGRLAGETLPDVIVCVADATNLRPALRLLLELKASGLPMLLALNMSDISERQGWTVDAEGLSNALGCPIVATAATRRRGRERLIDAVEGLIHSGRATPSTWREPSAAELRRLHREVERLLRLYVRSPVRPDTLTGRLDSVLLHPVWGLVVLLTVLFVMFQAVFTWAKAPMELLQAVVDASAAWVKPNLGGGLVGSFFADGLISGVGSVIVFLPQIMVLFLFIILLEDFGYMARAAFLMDRIMGGAGLHGRAFIPLLSSFACAIPGVMSTRVIDNRRDRLATILVAPLMTCSARIPVYTLIVSAFIRPRTVAGFISEQGLVMFGLYAAGIFGALGVSFVLRKVLWRGASEPLLLELPAYKIPDVKNVALGVFTRAKVFLQRAGTTITAMMVLVWFLSSTPQAPAGFVGPAINYSLAGRLGHLLEPLLRPVGFNWQIAMALIPGLAAREVMVGALGTVYAVSGAGEGALGATLAGQWSHATAFALLAWYVFAPQCMATLGVIRRETNSWFWPIATFVYMLTLAYSASFIVFQSARALGA